jgi:hypothetical protein
MLLLQCINLQTLSLITTAARPHLAPAQLHLLRHQHPAHLIAVIDQPHRLAGCCSTYRLPCFALHTPLVGCKYLHRSCLARVITPPHYCLFDCCLSRCLDYIDLQTPWPPQLPDLIQRLHSFVFSSALYGVGILPRRLLDDAVFSERVMRALGVAAGPMRDQLKRAWIDR